MRGTCRYFIVFYVVGVVLGLNIIVAFVLDIYGSLEALGSIDDYISFDATQITGNNSPLRVAGTDSPLQIAGFDSPLQVVGTKLPALG